MTHPIDTLLTNGVAVSKASFRSYAKTRLPLVVATAAELRSMTLTGVTAPVYITALQRWYQLDTTDTTTPDDGVSVIRDFVGNGFFVYEGALDLGIHKFIAASPLTITSKGGRFIIAQTTPTALTINLPAAVNGGAEIEIVDANGVADLYPITIDANGSDTIRDAATFVMDAPFQTLRLAPRAGKWDIVGL